MATQSFFADTSKFVFPPPRQPLVVKTPFERFLLGSPDEAVDAFLRSWSPDLILRLRVLNSSFFFAVEVYAARDWSIRSALRPWFPNGEVFMRLLEQCGGVISGSVAVQFLGREAFTPSNLDVYVPLRGLLRLGRYLEEENFEFQAAEDVHELFDVAALGLSSAVAKGGSLRAGLPSSPSGGALATFTFYRPSSPGLRAYGVHATHVEVVVTAELDPVQFILTNSHSSKCSLQTCWQRPMTEFERSRCYELYYVQPRSFPVPFLDVPRPTDLRVPGYRERCGSPSDMDRQVLRTWLRGRHCAYTVQRRHRSRGDAIRVPGGR